MNRRSQGSLPVSKATTGFLQYKAAEGLSPTTLQSYQRDLKLWQIYAGDIPAAGGICVDRWSIEGSWGDQRGSKDHQRRVGAVQKGIARGDLPDEDNRDRLAAEDISPGQHL